MDSYLKFQTAKRIKRDAALGWIRFRLLWLEKLNEVRLRRTLGSVTLSPNHGTQRNRRQGGVGSVIEGSRVVSAGFRQRPGSRGWAGGLGTCRACALGLGSEASTRLASRPAAVRGLPTAPGQTLLRSPTDLRWAHRARAHSPRALGTPRRAKGSLSRPFSPAGQPPRLGVRHGPPTFPSHLLRPPGIF